GWRLRAEAAPRFRCPRESLRTPPSQRAAVGLSLRVTTVGMPVANRRPVPAARWLAPSLADIIFGALLLWLALVTMRSDGSLGLLLDSNTGYHIRTGDFILTNRTIPHSDIFSFSRPGQPWFAWEWLCAV